LLQIAGWVRLLGFFRQNIFHSCLLNLYAQTYLSSNNLAKLVPILPKNKKRFDQVKMA